MHFLSSLLTSRFALLFNLSNPYPLSYFPIYLIFYVHYGELPNKPASGALREMCLPIVSQEASYVLWMAHRIWKIGQVDFKIVSRFS